ncbi:MAG: pyridoxamine 5'-phosphate oxidase family protein [Desulfobacterales bacterium]|jgi:3-hydroxyisobutyrate dehydrogenase
MKKKTAKWDTLETILSEAWAMLGRGVSDFNDPFHWPVLATNAKGGINLRTVILRQFTLPERVLVCHTDARAEKVQEISKSANVSWLFYHPQKKVQLRISGQATLHANDQIAEDQWAATRITSRLNYCAAEPPGTPVNMPSYGLPDLLLKKVPSLLESERYRNNFMVIACRIDSMDWLMLGALGNRRARFDWDEKGSHATWLIP